MALAHSGQAVSSYQLILPPGWVQHPVRPGVAEKLLAHVRTVFEQAPQAAPLYTSLRTSVYKAMRDLRARGGVDVFLPERTRSGDPLPVSLVSSMVKLGDRGIDAALQRITNGRPWETVAVPTGSAYAWNSETKGRDDLAGIDSADRFCLFPLPGDQSGDGLLFSFGVLRTPDMDDEYQELLFVFFDMMMQSVIWMSDEGH